MNITSEPSLLGVWALVDRLMPAGLDREPPASLRRARIVVLMCASSLILTLFASAWRATSSGLPYFELWTILVACVVFPTPIVVLNVTRSSHRAGATLMALGMAAAALSGGVRGGILSSSMPWLALSPLIAAFLMGIRSSMVVGAASISLVAVFYLGPTWFGPFPNLERSTGQVAELAFINLVAISVMCTVVGSMYEWLVQANAQALARSGRSFRVLAENVLAGTVVVQNTRVVFANAAAQRLFGVDSGDLLGMQLQEYCVDPLSLESLSATPRELEMVDALGDTHHVDVNAAPIEFEGEVAWCVTLVDQTQRREEEAERMALHHRMQDAQQAETVRVLAGGVAHDFNNLLAVIVGNAHLLARASDITEDDLDLVRDIQSASERAAELVKQLLAQAGRVTVCPEQVLLGAVVVETARLCTAAAGVPERRVTVQVEDPALSVVTDPTRLRQIVANLVTNALEASSGLPVSVSVTSMQVSEAFLNACAVRARSKPGEFVAISVTDVGNGMDQHTANHLFEPFFSSKGHGRGLGLAAVRSLVKDMGGAISLQTALSKGSKFTFVLPRRGDETENTDLPPLSSANATELRRGKGRVLVVDDQILVRTQMRRILQQNGFRTVEAEDAASAVQRFSEGGRFDAVVLDYLLPDSNGSQVRERLLAIDANTPVILCTGFVDETFNWAEHGFQAVVCKPFTPTELLDAVHGALEPGPGMMGGELAAARSPS